MSKIVGNIVGNALDLSNLNTNGGSAELDSEIFKKDIIIPETSLALTEYSPYTRTYIHSDVVFKDGETYIVNWEGTKYTCVGKQVSGGVILGNGGVFGYSATDDPFCIRYIENPVGVPDNLEILSVAALTSATVEITTPPMIDPRYIPNMYYTEERNDVVILPPSSAIDIGQSIMGELYVVGGPITLVEGYTYKVIYNGVEYESVASKIYVEAMGGAAIFLGDANAVIGSPSGQYPFILCASEVLTNMGASVAIIPLGNVSSITVSIIANDVLVHTISDEYLPDIINPNKTPYLAKTIYTYKNTTTIYDSDIVNFFKINRNYDKLYIDCGVSNANQGEQATTEGNKSKVLFTKIGDRDYTATLPFDSFGGIFLVFLHEAGNRITCFCKFIE